jgi:hypothetical protein
VLHELSDEGAGGLIARATLLEGLTDSTRPLRLMCLARRSKLRPRARSNGLSMYFALFGVVNTVKLGPMTLLLPEWHSLDLRAATTFACLMLFALKQNLGRTLALCAITGVVLKGLT